VVEIVVRPERANEFRQQADRRVDVVEVGGDLEWLPMRSSGMSLVIRDVTMSGS
jgi:hypothetical protein